MTAIGFGVAWAGFAVAILGYCWVRDYNVTVTDLFRTTWPGSATGKGTPSSQVVPSPTGQPTTAQQLTGQ